MFNSVTTTAKRVRPGSVIKVAGKKYMVVRTLTTGGKTTIHFTPANRETNHVNVMIVDNDFPIKIVQK